MMIDNEENKLANIIDGDDSLEDALKVQHYTGSSKTNTKVVSKAPNASFLEELEVFDKVMKKSQPNVQRVVPQKKYIKRRS